MGANRRSVVSNTFRSLLSIQLRYNPAGETRLLDANGAEWFYEYDASENLVRIVDPYGAATLFERGPGGELIAEIDGAGRRTEYIADAAGAQVSKRLPDGTLVSLPEDWNAPDPTAHRVPGCAIEWEYGDLWDLGFGLPDELELTELPPEVRAVLTTSESPQRGRVEAVAPHGPARERHAVRLLEQRRAAEAVDPAGNTVHYGALTRSGLRARIADMLDDVSRCISEGNLKVFAEIAPIFASFICRFHDTVDYDRSQLEAFVATLKPGPPAPGGQDLLAEAMTHYHDAMFELAPKRKAELILLANAKVGLHEQQRLQPNILEGLDAPIRAGLGGVLGRAAVAPVRRVLPPVPRRLGAALEEAMNAQEWALLVRATAVWRRMVTRRMIWRKPGRERDRLRAGRRAPHLAARHGSRR